MELLTIMASQKMKTAYQKSDRLKTNDIDSIAQSVSKRPLFSSEYCLLMISMVFKMYPKDIF